MAPTLHRGIGRDVITRVAADQWSRARHNDLLASLPAAVFNRLDHALEPVDLFLGHVLWEAGCEAEHVYFPVTGIVSLMQDLASGATAEVAVVGNEGLVGIVLVLVARLRRLVHSCALRARATTHAPTCCRGNLKSALRCDGFCSAMRSYGLRKSPRPQYAGAITPSNSRCAKSCCRRWIGQDPRIWR